MKAQDASEQANARALGGRLREGLGAENVELCAAPHHPRPLSTGKHPRCLATASPRCRSTLRARRVPIRRSTNTVATRTACRGPPPATTSSTAWPPSARSRTVRFVCRPAACLRTHRLLTHTVLRIKSFQSYTMEHDSPLAVPAIQAMVEDYLGRDDDELAKLASERRAGRPPTTRETLLKRTQATEQAEYASGFWVPDLEDADNLRRLKEWKGQWSSLATLTFARIAKDGSKRESSFPPKGLS